MIGLLELLRGLADVLYHPRALVSDNQVAVDLRFDGSTSLLALVEQLQPA
ncbi:unnamed protein product [Toxocara canis]|uniref:Chorein_N domain-containing protein n=1 Tax=Toxocara canis TaxID=6265 RepID=A0A183UFI2_TOXCA|nr:unnamed protein product [Toxocara canis]